MENTTQTSYIFGISADGWEKIIIAVIAALAGAIFSYIFQWGLKGREAKVGVIKYLAERRIQAYEEIIAQLDIWGRVFPIPLTRLEMLLVQGGFNVPYQFPAILLDYKSLLAFKEGWFTTFSRTHLWIDRQMSEGCKLINWYLVALTEALNYDRYDLPAINEKQGRRAVDSTLLRIGGSLFDDYHLLADPIYRRMTKYFGNPKFGAAKKSIRDFDRREVKNLMEIQRKTKLVTGRKQIQKVLLEELGVDEERIKEIQELDFQ